MVLPIKIPDSLYVGVRGSFNRMLGHVTPFGSDTAFLRRKATVDQWLSRSGTFATRLGTFVLRNDAIHGFTIGAGTMWSDNDWYITDPRGFTVSISAANMQELLDSCVIEHGEIMQRCCYGRRRQSMVLLPEHSQQYREAVTYTNLQIGKVSIRDVAPGNRVFLKNGLEAQYLGYLYPIRHNDGGLEFDAQRLHHFRITDTPAIHIVRRIEISRIIDHNTISDAEAEATIAAVRTTSRLIADGRISTPFSYVASTSHRLSAAHMTIELEPTDKYTIINEVSEGRASGVVIGVVNDTLWRGYFLAHQQPHRSDVECMRVDRASLLTHAVFRYIERKGRAPLSVPASPFAYVLRSRSNTVRKKLDIDQTAWHFVKVHLRNPVTGTNISLRLA